MVDEGGMVVVRLSRPGGVVRRVESSGGQSARRRLVRGPASPPSPSPRSTRDDVTSTCGSSGKLLVEPPQFPL